MIKFSLQGSLDLGNISNYLDVQMVACASEYTLFDGSVIGADEDCEWDKNEMLEYLGPSFYFTFYHN